MTSGSSSVTSTRPVSGVRSGIFGEGGAGKSTVVVRLARARQGGADSVRSRRLGPDPLAEEVGGARD
jgi:ABC-type dipeptide/oligopeptide/nickel transport system ATPase subunit